MVEKEILRFFALWKMRGKEIFFTAFPHLCGEKRKTFAARRKFKTAEKASSAVILERSEVSRGGKCLSIFEKL